MEKATFGGGCFWCLEAVYDQIEGVEKVVSGYAGGDTPNPSYEQVSTGRTGHAEVTQITFDPAVVSYEDLLNVFFSIHDPTTLNRQGADIGTQYRSIILAHTPEQKAAAEAKIKELEEIGLWDNPIVTQVEDLGEFYPAEAYHQNYYENHPNAGYCRVVIAPKVAKFRKQHLDKLKAAAR